MRNLFNPSSNEMDLFGQPTDPMSRSFDQDMMFPDFNLMNPIPGPEEMEYNPSSRMSQLYNPEEEAKQRLNQLMSQYPQREKPGMFRRIAAGLAGAHYGPQVAEHVLDRPFRNKLEDWKNRMTPAVQSAQLERMSNVNERTLAYQTVSNELREQAQKERERNNVRNAEIRESRAEVYRIKSLSPNFKFDFSGPTVKIVNPKDGSVTVTGVQTGHLSDIDKMNLTQEHALARIGATGDESRKTEDVRQTGRESLEGIRQEGRESLEGVRQTGRTALEGQRQTGRVEVAGIRNASRPELPTQARVREFRAARELFNSRPDLRPFIKLNTPGANDFNITPPSNSRFRSGPTPEQHDEINRIIFGTKGSGNIDIKQPGRTSGSDNIGTDKVSEHERNKTDTTNTVNIVKRSRAIKILQDQKKPVTEANIEYVMKQLP